MESGLQGGILEVKNRLVCVTVLKCLELEWPCIPWPSVPLSFKGTLLLSGYLVNSTVFIHEKNYKHPHLWELLYYWVTNQRNRRGNILVVPWRVRGWMVNPRFEQLILFSLVAPVSLLTDCQGSSSFQLLLSFPFPSLHFQLNKATSRVLGEDHDIQEGSHCLSQTHYLPIPWIWSFRCRELTLPIGKGEASLWLHARFSGLRKATREQAITCYPLEHVSREEKKKQGTPTERCTLSGEAQEMLLSHPVRGAPWRTSLHDLARNHRRERKLFLFCFV